MASTAATSSSTRTRAGSKETAACSVAKLTVASTLCSLFNFFSMRAAQDAQVMPSRSSRIFSAVALISGGLVAGLVDRGTKSAVVEIRTRHRDELRLQVDLDRADARDRQDLLGDRPLAVTAVDV